MLATTRTTQAQQDSQTHLSFCSSCARVYAYFKLEPVVKAYV